MTTPVSWYALQRGWDVRALDGARVGKVAAVLGDEELDIFHGLEIHVGATAFPRVVPAERVSAIEEGVVTLDVLVDEVGSLPAPDDPDRD